MGQRREIDLNECVRRLQRTTEQSNDVKFSFFLGAGCSYSSGIPMAGQLVIRWLPKLKGIKTGDDTNWEEWAAEYFDGFGVEIAAEYYGQVIEELFFTGEERQQEIERLTEGKEPAFGYATMAQLMSHIRYGRHFNTVLTPNFDDMIADAMYLYTNKKPLVIAHESLAGFARVTRTRPLVIKLHGDARLDPKNTTLETEELADEVKTVVKNILSETGLIFMGYGGNDESIANILSEIPEQGLPWGIYWVNDFFPENALGELLDSRDAIWVNHLDFDETMLLMRREFDLDHPNMKRLNELEKTYFDTLKNLRKKVDALEDTEEKAELQEAVDMAIEDITDWWSVEIEADQYKENDPDKADAIYRQGLEKFPNSVELLGNYANFLRGIGNNMGKAEEYYQRALQADPNDANALGNYASFLQKIRKDMDLAEEFFQRALQTDPNHASHLGNYAVFLKANRKDADKAEEYYLRSLDIHPNSAIHLGNYAIFLKDIRKDHERAEEYYQRALDVNPNNAHNLGNYGGFLLSKGDKDNSFKLVNKALKLVNNWAEQSLILECSFYLYAHGTSNKEGRKSLNHLKELINSNVRSPGWNLEANVKRAIEDNHPEPEFLALLAKVIAEETDAKELEKHPVWNEA